MTAAMDRQVSVVSRFPGVRGVRKVSYRPLSNPPLPGILAMTLSSMAAALPVDGRQSQTALAIARGTARYLHALGYCVVSELPLPSGRRADLVALGGDGEIVIVEIKSSVADFRADQKWMDYRLHCDRLFFATIAEVPCEIFPADAGLIVADAFGASIVCEAPEHRLPAATRKSIMLRFAHAAALRLQALADPQGPYARRILKLKRYAATATVFHEALSRSRKWRSITRSTGFGMHSQISRLSLSATLTVSLQVA